MKQVRVYRTKTFFEDNVHKRQIENQIYTFELRKVKEKTLAEFFDDLKNLADIESTGYMNLAIRFVDSEAWFE